ncbi:MAG: hypothetical protein ACI9OJ_000781 [Myxococcota bacterium]|jgi:hypothetical protein
MSPLLWSMSSVRGRIRRSSLAFTGTCPVWLVTSGIRVNCPVMLKNIAHQSVLGGHSILLVTAAKPINDLAAQDSACGLERRLKHCAGFGDPCDR